MDKKEKRAAVREKARGLTADYRARASADIVTRLILYPYFQQVKNIFCYVSMEGEPDTRNIIETAWSMGKKIYVPKCAEGNTMKAVQIRDYDDLEPGTMGILEPKDGLPEIDAYKLDLAVIPCVSADPSGHRLGHGAGYYDRFLKGQKMYKFCLCFEELLSQDIPVTAEDVLMDRVITENRIYNPRMAGNNLLQEIENEEEPNAAAAAFKKLLHGLFKKHS